MNMFLSIILLVILDLHKSRGMRMRIEPIPFISRTKNQSLARPHSLYCTELITSYINFVTIIEI